MFHSKETNQPTVFLDKKSVPESPSIAPVMRQDVDFYHQDPPRVPRKKDTGFWWIDAKYG